MSFSFVSLFFWFLFLFHGLLLRVFVCFYPGLAEG